MAAVLAAAAPAAAGTVRHVPLAEAEAGDELTVEATADHAWESTIRLHVRPVLGERWTATEFQRHGDKLAAVIAGILARSAAGAMAGKDVSGFAERIDPCVELGRAALDDGAI